MINQWVHKMLGGSEREIVEKKRVEAHDIKNEITGELWNLQEELDNAAGKSNRELKQISEKLGDITIRIAMVTGRKGKRK